MMRNHTCKRRCCESLNALPSSRCTSALTSRLNGLVWAKRFDIVSFRVINDYGSGGAMITLGRVTAHHPTTKATVS
eukprot:m.205476 g.205476  ORF g.205476 m.205476 type:complete len:76 (-) comp15412_c0_seq2:777-1004(-)